MGINERRRVFLAYIATNLDVPVMEECGRKGGVTSVDITTSVLIRAHDRNDYKEQGTRRESIFSVNVYNVPTDYLSMPSAVKHVTRIVL